MHILQKKKNQLSENLTQECRKKKRQLHSKKVKKIIMKVKYKLIKLKQYNREISKIKVD